MKFKLIIDREKEESVVVTAHGPSALTEKIENLVLFEVGATGLIAFGEDEMRNLSYEEIECVFVEGRKTWAVDQANQVWRIKGTLSETEQMLPSYFVRVNKSAIANESRIQKYCTSFNSAVDVVFMCGHKEYVSRRCFAELKRRFGL